MANKQNIGNNVEVEVEGNTMIIKVDLTQDFGPSKSEKTRVVATTAGSKVVSTPVGNVLVGLNVNKKG